MPDKKQPDQGKKSDKIKDLPPKQVKPDSDNAVKGGIVGPCYNPKRSQ